jgi:hypothetical protein
MEEYTLKKECLNHCEKSAAHHLEMAKCFGKMAGLHETAGRIADEESTKAAGDELAKSYHEASRDVHKSMAGACEEISGHHADRAQHFLDLHKTISAIRDDVPTNANSFGSRDFRAALGANDSEDIIELLRKIGDNVMPTQVHAIAPSDNLRLVGRPGGPTVDVSDASIDLEFAKVFGFD